MPKRVLEKIIEQTELHVEMIKDLGVKTLERGKVDPLFGKKTDALRKLKDREIGDCRRCKLSKDRTSIVFGEGDPNAEIFFIGEGPGEREDETGRPFVGAAGKILTDIIERGIRIPRAKVFIANVVKCRPPKNRDPEPDEIESCRGFLEKQVKIVSPRVIVALGKVAAQFLLGTEEPISRMRGNWYEFMGFPLMPTFHPAYLLHNPGGKREVWNDIKQVLRLLAEEKQ